MVKLRDDLVGVVYLNGRAYSAGDEVPDDVRVGAHLTEDGQEHGAPAALTVPDPDAVAGAPEPLTAEESAHAEKVGLPTDIAPERVRGALVGYEQGIADTLAFAARGTAFDPSDANVEQVQQHIAENPSETAAVLALEAAGKARRTILDEYLR
ncbi:hypothetical protein [Cellulomonas sp. C5510]|uniref:hypothetical protein n=1 Tax=Cellulomonas sp. C5510 TaxID=2871170 RepID=UPI001C965F22|nr:hypothetical protein [Cellulomonas sp. C5510]QZN86892.1 hypothetical protein K5O09_07215 [Cellulomonas sp. C5510]